MRPAVCRLPRQVRRPEDQRESGTTGGYVTLVGANSNNILEIGVCAGQTANAINVRINRMKQKFSDAYVE